ncbi:MAG: hypothetical protein DCC65_12340 [Planctomycetota bacterium]|nr:MAG: hypothetical protein DCC65_12340 [Planctomycetota bacterium]
MPVRQVAFTDAGTWSRVPSALHMAHNRGSINCDRWRAASTSDTGEACSPAAQRWNPKASMRLFHRELPIFADALTLPRARPDNSGWDDGQGRP